MELCWKCHGEIHAEPAWAYEHGYLVHSYDDPASVPVDLKWPGERKFVQKEHEHRAACEVCGVEIKSKPRQNFKGEEKRQRKTVSIRVPDDAQEDGAGLLDENIEILEQKISGETHRPKYFTLLDALCFTILNAGDDDFL
jgi:hypothetical protein